MNDGKEKCPPWVLERESEARLDQAYGEMDALLYGKGQGEKMATENKPFKCKECPEAFEKSQQLASHVMNTHRRRRAPSAHARKVQKRLGGRASHAPVGQTKKEHAGLSVADRMGKGAACPLCLQPLPTILAGLVKDFAAQGVEEEQAARLAAIAYGRLHRPARA